MRIVVGLWSKDTMNPNAVGSIEELRKVLRTFSDFLYPKVAPKVDSPANGASSSSSAPANPGVAEARASGSSTSAVPSDPPAPASNLLGIFAVPENYRTSDESKASKWMEEDEKEIWLQQLRYLSDAFPSVLIVPGTTLWRKSVWRQRGGAGLGDVAPERPPGSRRERFDHRGRKFPDKPDSRLPKVSDLIRAQTSWMKQAEASGYQSRLVNFLADDVEDLQKKTQILANAPETVKYILRNTAYALFDGRVVHKYNKLADHGEIGIPGQGLSPDGTMFIPGNAWGYFSIDGLNVALEVCFDHPQGYTQQRPGPAPHVQILLSAAVPTQKNRIHVLPGGIFLHASAKNEYTEIRQNTNNGMEVIRCQDDNGGCTNLHVAEVHIPPLG